MSFRFLTTILLSYLATDPLLSQQKNFSDILPKGIEARPLLDTLNYLPGSLKQPVSDILTPQGFKLTKCFIDK